MTGPETRRASAYTRARTAAMRAEAKLKELTLRERAGGLLRAADVQAEAFAWGRRVRETILAWPAQVSGPLAVELGRDATTVAVALENAVHALLVQLAEDPAPADPRRPAGRLGSGQTGEGQPSVQRTA
jgi:hypothetical protein